MKPALIALVTVGLLMVSANISAQMIVLETPLVTTSDSFFERQGVGFGFNLATGGDVVGLGPDGNPTANGEIEFRFGGLDAAIPPFGGYDPNTDATLGFARTGKGGGLFFNFAFSQGNDRSIVSQTPTIVLTNGATGSVTDTTQRPFVTSVIPVLGDDVPPWERPIGAELPRAPARRQRRETARPPYAAAKSRSSATMGDASVAEIRRQQQSTVDDDEVTRLIKRAERAAEAGRITSARVYYRNALRQADSDRAEEIERRLEALNQRVKVGRTR